MGFLSDLATLPVSGPVKLVIWIAERLAEQADQQLYSPEALRRQLSELELQLDLGEITEEEYLEAEAALLEWLEVALEHAAGEQQQ